jgi:DNA-binding MarR family transcriptional regulator
MDNARYDNMIDDGLFDAGTYGPMPLVILSRSDLTPADKLVYVGLASHRRPDHTAVWPSARRLAAMTALSRDTVLSAIARLESKGLLVIQRTPGRSSVYRLRQTEANRSDIPTGRKNRPVGKNRLDRSGIPTPPVGNSDPEVLNGSTEGTTPPLPPASRGEVRVTSLKTAEEAIERIDAAYREVFGPETGLTSKERRKVRRGWANGDAWWLALIDAEAVRGGLKKSDAKDGEFGLGWVQKHIASVAARRHARKTSTAEQKRAAEQAAKREQARQEKDRQLQIQRRQAETDHWRTLDAADRERFLEAAKAARVFGRRTPEITQIMAEGLAYRDREAKER